MFKTKYKIVPSSSTFHGRTSILDRVDVDSCKFHHSFFTWRSRLNHCGPNFFKISGPGFIRVYKRKTMVQSIWSCLRQPRIKRTSLSKLDNWLPETDRHSRQSWRLQPLITFFFCEYFQNWAGPITKLRIIFMNVDLPFQFFIFVREHLQINFLKRTPLVTWTFTEGSLSIIAIFLLDLTRFVF